MVKTNPPLTAGTQSPDRDIDITNEVCPMTFVRTRLAMDAMQSGQMLRVRLHGAEPLRNVPRSARALGHEVVSQTTGADGVSIVVLRVAERRGE